MALKITLHRSSPVKLAKLFYALKMMGTFTVSKRGRLNDKIEADGNGFTVVKGAEILALVDGVRWSRGTFSLAGREILTINVDSTIPVSLNDIAVAIKKDAEMSDNKKLATNLAMVRAEGYAALFDVSRHNLGIYCKPVNCTDVEELTLSEMRQDLTRISVTNLYAEDSTNALVAMCRSRLTVLNTIDQFKFLTTGEDTDTVWYFRDKSNTENTYTVTDLASVGIRM